MPLFFLLLQEVCARGSVWPLRVLWSAHKTQGHRTVLLYQCQTRLSVYCMQPAALAAATGQRRRSPYIVATHEHPSGTQRPYLTYVSRHRSTNKERHTAGWNIENTMVASERLEAAFGWCHGGSQHSDDLIWIQRGAKVE